MHSIFVLFSIGVFFEKWKPENSFLTCRLWDFFSWKYEVKFRKVPANGLYEFFILTQLNEIHGGNVFMPHSIHTYSDWNRTPRPSHKPVRFIHISSYIKHTRQRDTCSARRERERDVMAVVRTQRLNHFDSFRYWVRNCLSIRLAVMFWFRHFNSTVTVGQCVNDPKSFRVLFFFAPQISILSISKFGLCGLEHFSAFLAFHSFGGGERRFRKINHADRVFGDRYREAKRWK